MITSTVLAVFFVPAFFVAIQGLSELIGGKRPRAHTKPSEPSDEFVPLANGEAAHVGGKELAAS
jgi:HAE1 family hydrophobic/amphiphilic exporter-1